MIQKGCWAAVATVGFAMLFNVPKYALSYCALIGALGYALRTALLRGDMGLVLATQQWGLAVVGTGRGTRPVSGWAIP